MDEVKIEKANGDDIEGLAHIYLLGYSGLEEYAYTHIEDALAYINWLFRRDVAGMFVAVLDGKKIGFIASDGNWFSKREGKVVGAIHELVVLPEYRGMGVGGTLLSKAVQYFKSRGLDAAELWVGDENLRALAFYKKHGFVEKDRFNYWVRMTRSLHNEAGGQDRL